MFGVFLLAVDFILVLVTFFHEQAKQQHNNYDYCCFGPHVIVLAQILQLMVIFTCLLMKGQVGVGVLIRFEFLLRCFGLLRMVLRRVGGLLVIFE